jgi:hypothetical protein
MFHSLTLLSKALSLDSLHNLLRRGVGKWRAAGAFAVAATLLAAAWYLQLPKVCYLDLFRYVAFPCLL